MDPIGYEAKDVGGLPDARVATCEPGQILLRPRRLVT